MPFSVLLDSDQRAVRMLGAKTTPEAFVIDATGCVRYAGRIDDRWSSRTVKKERATTHDTLAPGDAVVFPSEKRHGVTTLEAREARRRSVVFELWEGGITTHNRQR